MCGLAENVSYRPACSARSMQPIWSRARGSGRIACRPAKAAVYTAPMLNADPAELAKFSALAHRWWDPSSDFKPLHDINPLRLDYIAQRAHGLAGKTVLDV